MPSTHGVCGKSFGSRTRDTLKMSLFGTLQAACHLPVSERIKSFRLRFFGHLARSNPEEDHHRVIAAALRRPSDGRRPAGRPRTTWLRTIGEDYTVTEFRGPHGMEEGKGERYLASSRQYGNALLGVRATNKKKCRPV